MSQINGYLISPFSKSAVTSEMPAKGSLPPVLLTTVHLRGWHRGMRDNPAVEKRKGVMNRSLRV